MKDEKEKHLLAKPGGVMTLVFNILPGLSGENIY